MENAEKNCKMAIPAKKLEVVPRTWSAVFAAPVLPWYKAHMLAMRLNCSSKFLGRNVKIVYLDVTTWLVGKTQSL